jgi:hypothetical protein
MDVGPLNLLALSRRCVQVVEYEAKLSCVHFFPLALNRKRRAERAYSRT